MKTVGGDYNWEGEFESLFADGSVDWKYRRNDRQQSRKRFFKKL